MEELTAITTDTGHHKTQVGSPSNRCIHHVRTTAWAAIGRHNIYGPFFFDESVNSDRYLVMLRDKFWPALQRSYKEEEALFMQDGAPPHWAIQVRRWLDEHFPQRWMGRGSPNMPWSPRSPDLSPCDFFMWGFIKSRVYTTRPTDIPDLKLRVQTAFHEITPDMRQNVVRECHKRLEKVIENSERHIEVSVN